MSEQYVNLDPDEWMRQAKTWIARGFHVHQKWTCGRCRSRQVMDNANRYFTKGTCEQCGWTTDIKGANFLSVSEPCIIMNDDFPKDFDLLFVQSDEKLTKEKSL